MESGQCLFTPNANMTYLVFIDDSKDRHLCCFGAVVASGEQIAKVDSRLSQLRSNYEFECLVEDIPEFHGHEIFQGEGPWSGVNAEIRFEAMRSVLNAGSEAGVHLIFRGIRTAPFAEKYHSMKIEVTAFSNLLERVQEFLDDRDSYGFITSDRQDAQSTELRADLVNAQLFGTRGYRSQNFSRIVDTLHFVDSKQSSAVQLADVATFVWRRLQGPLPKDERAQSYVKQLGEIIETLIPHPRAKYQAVR